MIYTGLKVRKINTFGMEIISHDCQGEKSDNEDA